MEPLDPAILQWCEAHALIVCTDYKDHDARSVDVIFSWLGC